jgi:amino acid efflux transporter
MPQQMVAGTGAGTAPRRSLTVLTIASTGITLASAFGAISLDTLLRATSSCLVAVTLAGLCAATVLLPRRSLLRFGALIGSAVIGTVLLFCGPFLLLPAALAVAALAFHAANTRHRTGHVHTKGLTSHDCCR